MDVIGRETERRAIESLFARAERGPAGLVLSGASGLGRTLLWEAAVDEARRRFGRVLTCRAVQAEAALAFTGLSELLTDVVEEVAGALPSPRRRALEVALLVTEPGDEPPDSHAIGLALLDALRLLAQPAPVLIAVDDLQWLDSSSASVLQIALRRLRDERVALLATVHATTAGATSSDLARAFPKGRWNVVALEPLSPPELRTLLKDWLALDLSRPELSAVLDASDGNPFFALELGRELTRTRSWHAPMRGLQVPHSLQELLGDRVARLPTETRDVLLTVAASGRPSIDVVAAVHGDRTQVLEGLEEAEREGVVAIETGRVRFAQQLLASICYEQAPPFRRRAVHGALAEVVDDVEERARHLALAADRPDARVASTLDGAAERAAARGASSSAAGILEAAAELTPVDDDASGRRRRLRAAEFHLLSGDGKRAGAILEALLPETDAGVERADVLAALAWWNDRTDLRATITLLEDALVEAADDDVRCAKILRELAGYRVDRGDVGSGLMHARAALAKAERIGDPALVAEVLAQVGRLETYALEITPGLLERGVAIEERLERPLSFWDSPAANQGIRLLWHGDLGRARAVLEGFDASAAAHGDEASRGSVLVFLIALEWLAGHWERARWHAAAALELAEEARDDRYRAWVLYNEALVLANLGAVGAARAGAEEAATIAEAVMDAHLLVHVRGLLGHLALAAGDADAACRILRELPPLLLAAPFTGLSPIWPDAIESLLERGEREEASALLEAYERMAQHASAGLRALAGRSRGLLEAVDGNLDGALATMGEALCLQEGAAYPFERGRTLLHLGRLRRRAGRKRAAREALAEALVLFERLGADGWATRTRAELARISGRRPGSAELTDAEARVASLAVTGLTNKEIAAALFLTVHTVEAHLSQVYRKLGVHSRTELGARLLASDGGAAKPAEPAAKD